MGIFDFLFLDPSTCSFCKEEEVYKYGLCKSCLDKLDYVDNHFSLGEVDCYAIYFYNNFFASLISSYKYRRKIDLYKVFGEMAYVYGRDKGLFEGKFLLPAPSSIQTKRDRGFDHIGLICDYFLERTDMTYLEGFSKAKNTRPQHQLSLEDRQRNLRGAFSFDGCLSGEPILIFDDIITTGSTILEISDLLKEKGAGKVTAFCLASSQRVLE